MKAETIQIVEEFISLTLTKEEAQAIINYLRLQAERPGGYTLYELEGLLRDQLNRKKL